jgi:hypothetical protein
LIAVAGGDAMAAQAAIEDVLTKLPKAEGSGAG